MDELMDSDDETMFAALMEEEAEIAFADDEEHLMMLSCLMALYARTDTKPRRGGSAPGRRKSKPKQRWKATAFSTPTTSPTTHCTTRWYYGAIFG
jgi:hypothetical protein